jgi:hypothetical protein
VAPSLSFVIDTDLSRVPRPAEEVFTGCEDRPVAHLDAGRGLDFMCLSGRMDIPPTATILIEALIPGDSAAAGRTAWLLDRLKEESRMEAPGRAAMAAQLMQVIFIELIRTLPASGNHGWLAALSDTVSALPSRPFSPTRGGVAPRGSGRDRPPVALAVQGRQGES